MYRKLPVEIEAELARDLINAAATAWDSLPGWIQDAVEAGEVAFAPEEIRIVTLEGTMTADCGDMVIRGVKGEIYPCRPDIFRESYEPVEAAPC